MLEVEQRDLNTPVCALPLCYTPNFEKSRIVGTDNNPGFFWLNRVFKFPDPQYSFSSHRTPNWISLDSLVFLFCFISRGILSLKYCKIDLSIYQSADCLGYKKFYWWRAKMIDWVTKMFFLPIRKHFCPYPFGFRDSDEIFPNVKFHHRRRHGRKPWL